MLEEKFGKCNKKGYWKAQNIFWCYMITRNEAITRDTLCEVYNMFFLYFKITIKNEFLYFVKEADR